MRRSTVGACCSIRAIAARLAPCGINVIDDPVGVVDVALRYLGRNRDAVTARDFSDVEAMLAKIRPYVRNIDSSGEIEALANGDICLTLGYNGDVIQSRKRARESKSGVRSPTRFPTRVRPIGSTCSRFRATHRTSTMPID